MPFSFALFRPLLGLAIQHLISLHLSLPSSPIISQTHLSSTLRATLEAIQHAQPHDLYRPTSGQRSAQSPAVGTGSLAGRSSVDRSARPSSRASRISGADTSQRLAPVSEGGLLREMVEAGIGRGKEIWGMQPGRDVWRKLIG